MDVEKFYEQLFYFHGHKCPTVVAGVKMAQLGMEFINATKDEQLDLFTRVEYDWCGVDGIQFVTGCTPGNRNL
ncbi:MAG: FmdE family protein, partial [Candidatus Ranarchaeia archaeon]